jgi:endonuclease III related protein
MLYEIYTTLLAHFGPLHGPAASRPWWPIFGPDPLIEIVVGAVLVQQTRWEAVEGAIGRLQAAGLLSIAALAEAEPAALAALIRPCAFHSQKAPGLISIARHVRERHGDLPTMLAQPSAALRHELLGLPRIGPESADVIMLYAGGHPTFVVDAYTRRLFERVGLAMDGGRGANDEGRAGDERRKMNDEGRAGSASAIWQRSSYEQVRSHIETSLQLLAEAGELPSTVHRPPPMASLYAEYHAQINEQCVRYCLSRPRCDGPPARRVYSRQDGRESYLARDEGCPLRAICQHYKRGGGW